MFSKRVPVGTHIPCGQKGQRKRGFSRTPCRSCNYFPFSLLFSFLLRLFSSGGFFEGPPATDDFYKNRLFAFLSHSCRSTCLKKSPQHHLMAQDLSWQVAFAPPTRARQVKSLMELEEQREQGETMES